MDQIIKPVDPELIKAELTPQRKLCTSSRGSNELYVVTYHEAPNTVREIGRLREIAFRANGGGTGLSVDIDSFDTMESPCSQLLVWDPENERILGGYRFLCGPDMKIVDGQPVIPSAHLFHFSDRFMADYMPCTMELGRSFVVTDFQNTAVLKKMSFVLDNLWDGLAALMILNPSMKFYFGKATMYPSYPSEARKLLLSFLWRFFGDESGLIEPIKASFDVSSVTKADYDTSFKDEYFALKRSIRDMNVNIPPLINSYMCSSATMKIFGSSLNDDFGMVEETGLLIRYKDVFPDRRDRHELNFYSFEK